MRTTPIVSLVSAAAFAALVVGCGSSKSSSDAAAGGDAAGDGAQGGDGAMQADVPSGADAAGGDTSSDGAPGDGSAGDGTGADTGGGDGTAKVTLTVKNYLSWCSVSINGGTANTTASQTLDVAPGTIVDLNGDKANSTFVWGYWFGTAGDTTMAHDKAMMTTVTVDKAKTVQACCPFANSPTTPCPAP